MSATEEQDPTEDNQNRADDAMDSGLRLIMITVVTAEGLDGFAEIVIFVTSQVVTRAIQEAENWQLYTHPIIEDSDIQPAEQEEDMEEGPEEGNRKEKKTTTMLKKSKSITKRKTTISKGEKH
ncbi:hypothetical protein mRhiFer1_007887 [Rhinolophus ferrumequinum]|uniref:Uncharacterized protein n=1 Tax=Rhinolophus ferrumequinum TaxID=59479 RepID=A0A7J8AUS6_RHIFE|nr:hypothetical protein mRhiFer1_007887 [Rhinolophus ferrumequinum]